MLNTPGCRSRRFGSSPRSITSAAAAPELLFMVLTMPFSHISTMPTWSPELSKSLLVQSKKMMSPRLDSKYLTAHWQQSFNHCRPVRTPPKQEMTQYQVSRIARRSRKQEWHITPSRNCNRSKTNTPVSNMRPCFSIIVSVLCRIQNSGAWRSRRGPCY